MSPVWLTALVLMAPPTSGEPTNPNHLKLSDTEKVYVQQHLDRRTAQQWRDAVSRALRNEATSKGFERRRAALELINPGNGLQRETDLAESEVKRLRKTIRSRLRRISQRLEREIAREKKTAKKTASKPSPKTIDPPKGAAGVLAQAGLNPGGFGGAFGAPAGRAVGGIAGGQFGGLGAGAGGFGQATQTSAQMLVDLIRTTIAPESWAINGGPGTIFYFGPQQALVIRQTTQIHGNIGGLFNQLQR